MTVGKTIWVITAGRIPLLTTGDEPKMTSRDWISVLNISAREVQLMLTIFHPEKIPTGPFELSVKGNRKRVIRFNDLVNPEPILLQEAYAVVIESNLLVIVQFSRMDTSHRSLAISSCFAYAGDET